MKFRKNFITISFKICKHRLFMNNPLLHLRDCGRYAFILLSSPRAFSLNSLYRRKEKEIISTTTEMQL